MLRMARSCLVVAMIMFAVQTHYPREKLAIKFEHMEHALKRISSITKTTSNYFSKIEAKMQTNNEFFYFRWMKFLLITVFVSSEVVVM